MTVTPGSATLLTGASQQFNATVESSTDQSVTWSVNGILGGSSSLGFVSGAGFYTAPPIVPSPATVAVQATSIETPTASGSAAVTITAPSTVAVQISPSSATVKVRQSAQFTATVTGSSDPRVTWKVNGITGGNSTICLISTSGTYTAPNGVPNPATVTIGAVSVADPTRSATASVTISKK